MKKTLEISVFTSEHCPGALQIIHHCDHIQEWESLKSRYQVEDPYDHSFIFIQKDCTFIFWKNRRGLIQFCGSGAYATMVYLHELKKKLLLKTRNFSLRAHANQDGVYLQIPHKTVLPQEQFMRGEGTNIFLLEYQKKIELQKANWEPLAAQLKLDKPGGLCLYYWDQKELTGCLRYFTPWYGREEDYVTGSIHQFLSPLITKKYGVSSQRWYQYSRSPGVLISNVSKSDVIISGQWQAHSKSRKL